MDQPDRTFPPGEGGNGGPQLGRLGGSDGAGVVALQAGHYEQTQLLAPALLGR